MRCLHHQINGQVAGVAESGGTFATIVKAAKRFLGVLDYAALRSRGPEVPVNVPKTIERGIAFDGVSFTYLDAPDATLQDVSLQIPAGSVVALVGDNGAGKTTLVKLLLRMYEPEAGSIAIDGVPLEDFDAAVWRDHTTAAFQDFVRFNFTLAEAVGIGDLGRLDDPQAIRRALRRAGAEDVETATEHGLQTQLGRTWTRGVDLSGGQWQKVALARAMMRESPLLCVFDEPTASLDAETEHALFERFAAASRADSSRGMITLLVSHRFSTVRMADLIVVLEKGRIVEVGSHDELMRSGGLYAELYDLQASGYR